MTSANHNTGCPAGLEWGMEQLQYGPSGRPGLRLEEIPAALLALQRGEAMGIAPTGEVDINRRLASFLAAVQEQHIGMRHVHGIRRALSNPQSDAREVIDEFKGLFDALGENPAPQQESRALLRIFDADQLAELLVISPTSMQRYARGDRQPPEAVVERVHWLALVVGYLTGTYNRYGVRRWFERPRQALGGVSPKQALLNHPEWTPDSEGARRVEELAKSLIGMPVT